MTLDATIASLPAIAFGDSAPMSAAEFLEACGGRDVLAPDSHLGRAWRDLETQLRNAAAAARGHADHARRAQGCSIYWKNRVLACFSEKNPAKRQDSIDKTWWDAAGELADPASPLGEGALAAYAARLRILIRRSGASAEKGFAVMDRAISGAEGNLEQE